MPPLQPVFERPKAAFGKAKSLIYTSLRKVDEEGESSDGKPRADTNSHELWVPTFLRLSTIVSFLITFFAISSSLVALYIYSSRNEYRQGIKTDGSKYYYLWTYGPTAVFMVLGTFWSQVEYRAAQLMPWVLMLRGDTAGSDSIFLDYISDWNVVSLVKSLKKGHFLVSLCIVGSLLIKALAVFSTGLFELRPVRIDRPDSFTITHSFSGDNFRPEVDFQPFVTCQGAEYHNLGYPFGTDGSHAFPPFQLSSRPADSNYTIDEDNEHEVDLDVLSAYADCKLADYEVHNKSNPSLRMRADGCVLDTTLNGFWLDTDIDKPSYKDLFEGLSVGIYSCDGKGSSESGMNPEFREADWRVWAILAKRNGPTPEDGGLNGFEFKPLMCKVRYEMNHGPVRAWRSAGDATVSTSINSTKMAPLDPIPHVSFSDLTYATYHSMVFTATGRDVTQRFAYTLNQTQKDMWELPDFISAVEHSMTCTATQVARRYLLIPSDTSSEGTLRNTERRLFVRELSFGFMLGILCLLIMVSGALIFFYIPIAVCPRDPGSIGGIAAILAASPTFMLAFDGLETKQGSQMLSLLGQQNFKSGIIANGKFSVEPSNGDGCLSHDTGHESEIRWWCPASASLVMRLCTLLTPLILIAILEALYHHSADSGALGLIEGKSQYLRYVWIYIPALVMFGVRLFYQSMEFGTRVIQPYYSLRCGGARPDLSILENQHRKIGLYAIIDALRKQQWALAASALALFLAAVLPIVVSGLYVVHESGAGKPVSIEQSNRWNVGEHNDGLTKPFYGRGENVISHQEDMLAGMIMHLNLSYPTWTYEDLAFPGFKISPSSGSYTNDTKGTLETRLPALRARLQCEQVPTSECSVRVRRGKTEELLMEGERLIITCSELKESCGFTELGTAVQEEGSYFSTSDDWYTEYIPGCPTHLFTIGRWEAEGANPKIFKCHSGIEEVDVDVRLQLPSYEFDLDNPPTAVPGSEREVFGGFLSPTDNGARTLPYWSNMLQFLMNVTSPTLDPNTTHLDPVTQAAVYGAGGVPVEELFEDSNRMVESVNRIHGIVVAQLLNSWAHQPFRDDINPDSFVYPEKTEVPVYTGTFYDARQHLVQSRVSTTILEVLLGCMVACGIVTIALMKTRNILPKDPNSIAATASLLHGSRMLDRDVIPEGSEWCDDKELKKRGVFYGHTFTMGWWNRRSTTRKKSERETGLQAHLDGPGGNGQFEEGLLNEVNIGEPLTLDSDIGQNSNGPTSTSGELADSVDLGIERPLNERETVHDTANHGEYEDEHGNQEADGVENEIVYEERFGIDIDLDTNEKNC